MDVTRGRVLRGIHQRFLKNFHYLFLLPRLQIYWRALHRQFEVDRSTISDVPTVQAQRVGEFTRGEEGRPKVPDGLSRFPNAPLDVATNHLALITEHRPVFQVERESLDEQCNTAEALEHRVMDIATDSRPLDKDAGIAG